MSAPDDRLKLAYERYDRALPRHDREELVTARLSLCLALLETGWHAPEAVQEQMRRDEKTLRRLRDRAAEDDVLSLPEQRWLELRSLTEPSLRA